MLKKAFSLMLVFAFLLSCCFAQAEEMKEEDYADLADSGLQVWLSPALSPIDPQEAGVPENILYLRLMEDGSGVAAIQKFDDVHTDLQSILDDISENKAGLIFAEIREYGGVPFVVYELTDIEDDDFRALCAITVYGPDNKYGLKFTFSGVEVEASAEMAETMLRSIRKKPAE